MWTWLLSAALAGPCDVGRAAEIREALDAVGPEHRVELTASWVGQACTGAPGLAGAAARIPQVPPEMRPMIDATAVSEQPDLWLAMCAGGVEPVQRMVQVAPSEKRGVLWDGCALGKKGWFTEAEWKDATGLFALPLSVGQALSDSRFSDGDTRRIVRALAGIGGGDRATGSPPTPRLEPVLEFDPVEGQPPPVEVEPGLLDSLIGVTGPGSPDGSAVDGVPEAGAVLASAALDVKPGFVDRPQVRWSKGAKRSEQRLCKVAVTVRKGGAFGRVEWVDCPEALRPDVQKALEKAEYTPGERDGERVKGSFRTRFTVR